MKRSLTLAEWGGIVAVTVFVLDRLTKWWILNIVELPMKGSIEVLPIFHLTMVWNKGVSFGMFQADSLLGRTILVVFALAVSGFLIRWLMDAERRLQAITLGLIIGGAIGNALDRILYGAVADFLDFSHLRLPFLPDLAFKWIFNIADMGISIGVGLLVLDAFFVKEEGKEGQGQSK